MAVRYKHDNFSVDIQTNCFQFPLHAQLTIYFPM